MTLPVIITDRLVLCPHETRHFEPSAAMWGSPSVTQHIGGTPRSRQEAWFTICRNRGMWDLLGYSSWAIEDRETGAFIGEGGFADFMRGMTAGSLRKSLGERVTPAKPLARCMIGSMRIARGKASASLIRTMPGPNESLTNAAMSFGSRRNTRTQSSMCTVAILRVSRP